MVQLYTVVLQQLKLVSRFDGKGRKISDTEEKIEVTFRDLPLSTAMMYQKTSAHGACQVIKQEASSSSSRQQTRVYSSHDRRSYEQRKPAEKQAPKVAPANTIQNAAATGNLAAAINAS
jgi:hypothetical protein